MDNLTIALCLSIGSAVGWLIAIYAESGPRLLIWNVAFGMVGAALCALVLAWIEPAIVVAGLVMAGPFISLLTIIAGQAIMRSLSRATSGS